MAHSGTTYLVLTNGTATLIDSELGNRVVGRYFQTGGQWIFVSSQNESNLISIGVLAVQMAPINYPAKFTTYRRSSFEWLFSLCEDE
jgi:hypothetical protein